MEIEKDQFLDENFIHNFNPQISMTFTLKEGEGKFIVNVFFYNENRIRELMDLKKKNENGIGELFFTNKFKVLLIILKIGY